MTHEIQRKVCVSVSNQVRLWLTLCSSRSRLIVWNSPTVEIIMEFGNYYSYVHLQLHVLGVLGHDNAYTLTRALIVRLHVAR